MAVLLFPKHRKQALIMLPIVWLPDLDYLIPSTHRAMTHTIWIPLILLLVVVGMYGRSKREVSFATFIGQSDHRVRLMFASYYWATHIFLDIFAGGVVLFWPIWDTNFYIFYQIVLDTGSNTFSTDSEVGTSEGAPKLTPRYTWFSAEHNAILWYLAVTFGALGLNRLWKKRAENQSMVHKREKGA